MELKDLKTGLDVVMVSAKYVADNMDKVDGGFIDRATKMFFSDDMVEKLCGKKHKVEDIDATDNKLNVVCGGFWCNNNWIEKIYVPVQRPKRVAKAVDPKAKTPTKAADGSTFGVVFKKLLKKYPELGVLSTNRFTNLQDDEIEQICELLNIEFNEDDKRTTCQNIFNAIIDA